MRPYTEYVFLFGGMFVLFIAYLIITTRTDATNLDLNGLKVSNNGIETTVSLYIDSNCTANNFASLKHNNNFYSSTAKKLAISNFNITALSTSNAILKIGYADSTVACGSVPTNPVYKYINNLPDKDEYLSIDGVLLIPAGKYPFVTVDAYNFSFSATATEY